MRRDDTHWDCPLPPALAGQGQKASSLFFFFCGACVLTHFPHRGYRDDNHTSLLPHTLYTGLAFLPLSLVCSCASHRTHPRTAFHSSLSCFASATRSCKKGKATLFIHGLFLKLQACGAVYMKQIQIQIEQKFLLRIPTGGRLTSWLLTKRGEVEFGTTEDKSI